VRILLITPYYFPYINPRAHRWTSIAEEWAKNGHEIHVICSKRNDLPNLSQHNNVTIHRTGYNSLKEVFYNLFKSKKRRGEAQTSQSKTLKRSRLMTFMVWFNEVFWKKFYFPDDACVWYFPARKKAIYLLNKYEFNAFVSVSLPFSAHLVGLYCKKQFPKIHWLVDVGDPFSLQFNHPLNNHFLYKNLNVRLEKKVFEKADSISVTTDGTKKLYEQYFQNFENKIHVIPPLLKLNSNEKLPFDLSLDSSKIHIGYFGSFFKNVREPDIFLELLKKTFELNLDLKNKLVIHFFGDITEYFLMIFERYSVIEKNIKLHGLIPREAISDVMSQMNFLLNISNQSNFQIPSKSVDYMASGKPIINICSIEDDLFKQFFEEYDLIENILLTEKNISKETVKSFKNFIEKNNGQVTDNESLKKGITPFLTPQIAQKYLDIFT